MTTTGEDCVTFEDWVRKPCDIEGHDIECYRIVCPSCGDTMSSYCDD